MKKKNKGNKNNQHSYSLEEYGLSKEELTSGAYKEYSDKYNLQIPLK